MENNAEKKVAKFYTTIGWETQSGVTEDARRFEDLRECAREYVRKCRLRVLRHIPANGENMLDMASGPIQYEEYLEYSRNFKKRYCIDLSSKALDEAKKEIGDYGVFLCGSFFDIALGDNFFDCSISLHTIYHIDKDKQEEAVRKLIRVTKPGMPVIIVYSNPKTLISRCFIVPIRFLKSIKSLFSGKAKKEDSPGIYSYRHPLTWWKRFNDTAEIKILPWRSFASEHQKILIPNNRIGKKIFDVLFDMEERFPDFFVRHFQYPMVVLIKKS